MVERPVNAEGSRNPETLELLQCFDICVQVDNSESSWVMVILNKSPKQASAAIEEYGSAIHADVTGGSKEVIPQTDRVYAAKGRSERRMTTRS